MVNKSYFQKALNVKKPLVLLCRMHIAEGGGKQKKEQTHTQFEQNYVEKQMEKTLKTQRTKPYTKTCKNSGCPSSDCLKPPHVVS